MIIILKIKKILKSIFYTLLNSSPKIYEVYNKLDILLIYLKEIGIKEYSEDSDGYYATITFNDGTTYYYWDENKWYAWMRKGKINFSNGKILEWNDKMPSSEVIYKYKKATKKYRIKIHNNNNCDYSEYLPLKLIRKIKLKKLK